MTKPATLGEAFPCRAAQHTHPPTRGGEVFNSAGAKSQRRGQKLLDVPVAGRPCGMQVAARCAALICRKSLSKTWLKIQSCRVLGVGIALLAAAGGGQDLGEQWPPPPWFQKGAHGSVTGWPGPSRKVTGHFFPGTNIPPQGCRPGKPLFCSGGAVLGFQERVWPDDVSAAKTARPWCAHHCRRATSILLASNTACRCFL